MIAGVELEERPLLLRLHPLGHDGQPQRVGEIDHVRNDRRRRFVRRHVTHEGAVDFHRVDRESLQVDQRRLAGAEVVDGDADADLLQLAHGIHRHLDVLHGHRLGNLEFDPGGIAGVLPHDAVDHPGEAELLELWRRDVDPDPHRRQAGVPPVSQVVADAAQNPFADRNDESRLLAQADEVARRDQPPRRMVPPDQRFERDDFLPVAVEDRLIVKDQLIALEGVVQTLLERQPTAVALVHAGREHLRLIAAQLLGAVHGAVGGLEQGLDLVAVAGEDTDADRGGDEQLVSLDAERMR